MYIFYFFWFWYFYFRFGGFFKSYCNHFFII